MFVIAVLVLICSVSFVSANELGNATNLENDGLSLEESDFQVDVLNTVNDDSSIDDNYTSSQEDDSKLGFSGGEEVLNVSNDDQLSDSKMGTSDELAKLINDAKPGSTVTLDKDYNIRLGSSHAIEFTKAITLDGRGHTIFVYAYAFKINHPPSSAYLQIKNINFINGINGIIKNTKAAGPFIISNCNFTKPENGNNGGAIVVSGKYESYIINCTFTNCVAFPRTKVVKLETFSQIFSGASSSGGAIYSSAPITVKSCRFENCTAGDGGAVYVARSQAKIIDSVFVNNRAGRGINVESFKHGGAIYVFKAADGVLVKGCTFIGNHADRIGGAISVNSENTRIEDCIFDSNYIGTGRYNMGGAIYVTNNQETPKTSIQITRCSFNNNGYVGNEHYCKYGGAIFFSKNINGGTISYCNFTGNKVSEQGGAAYSESTCPNLKFIGCIFTKNHANDKGGAIYLDSKNNVVDGCVFDSNSADDDGGAIYVEARYNSIKNSLFTNNNAKDEGGAVYINARYTKIDLSAFTGNSAKKGYDIYCDSSYCSLTGSIILGNSPKNAIYSSSSFSASKNWWGNLASNKDTKPDVNKKVNLENDWNYLYYTVKYDYTKSAIAAVVEMWLQNVRDGGLSPYYPLVFDLKFTNTVSNQNTMTFHGVSDFIVPLVEGNTAVTISTKGWSHKIDLNYGNPLTVYNRSLSNLKWDIDNAGSVLNLTSDYEYMDICDKNLINGITFNKELVIDGNGHTINGKNTTSLLQGGYGKDLTLKNINFINIKNIYKANGNLFIENCTFNNCGNGLELLRITAGVITISDSNFYNCSSDSSMFIFDAYGGPDVSIIRCEFIGNKANCLMEGYRCESFNFIQNIFLNNSFTNMHNFKMGNPAHANYDYNWFGNTIYDFDTKPHVNVDLNTWMVLDLVNSKNTFETKYVYLKVYNANSQELENNTALNIGFNVSSIGGVVGFVDVNSGIGIMNYTFALRDVITLSHISNNFSFYIVNYLPGSFADLQYQIDNGGSVLNLTRNYDYMPICDSKLQYIDIDKPLILNGNGFTIDAKGMTNMARITGNTVQILNTTFSNSKGSAIQIMANNVLINSTFTNNTNLVGSGGAIRIYGSNNVVIDSTFIKNTAKYAGAISIDNSENVVINSIFMNNTAILGGAIYSEMSDVSISGVFANNSAKNGAAIYIHARSDKLNRIYKSLFISNRGIDSVINVAGTPKFHAADVHHSIFIDNNCLYDIASGNKDIVNADYNWFGNTNENYNVKPNVESSVKLNRWLFLDANANSTLLKIDESAVINVSLNNAYDRTSRKVYDVETNLPDVCFDVSSVNNAVALDKLELVRGKGNASYMPVNEGVGSVDFKYYSFNKTVTFNVVSVPEDSFTKLQEIINNASVHDSIVLNRSYKYYPNFDGDLKNGIVINKSLMVNGNGHVIDGANQARLFNLTTNSIELYNFILVNGYAENGSVIYSNAAGDKLSSSIVLNSTGSVIYCPFWFAANENWFGNTIDDYDVAPVVEGDQVELNNWLFLTVDVSKFDLFVGDKAIITLNLTNMYDATKGTNSTFTGIIPVTFVLSCVGGDINVSEATLIDGVAELEFIGDGIGSGYLEMSCYNVNEEFYFNVSCDDDSFTALQKLINNANGKIVLQHDYMYYDYDEKLKSGILINKSHIEIDGDGHVIDASNKAGVFNIAGEYVAVYDVSIFNSKNTVSVDGGYAAFDNVSFISNADVISVVDGSMEIVGCYFLNNSNVVDLKSAYDVFISDSTFINNTNIINAFYSTLTVNNNSFKGNDVGTYCVSLIDSTAEIHSSKFNEVNLINPIFVSIDSELYLSKNILSKSQYIDNEGTITSKTRIVIPGEKYYDLLIYVELTLNATVYDDNGNIIKVNDLEFNIYPTIDYNESSQGTVWILNVYCYPCGEHEVNVSVIDSLSDYSSDHVILNVSKFSSSVNIVSLDNITSGEVLNVKVECTNFTGAVIEISDASGEVIFRQTGDMTELSVESLDAGVYTLTYTNVGDEEYESSSVIATFEVYKIESDVVILDKVDSIYAFNDYRINFTVSNRANVTAKIVDLKTGEVIVNMSVYGNCLYVNLLAGSYNLTVTNVGDNNHETSSDSMVFDVLKVKSSVKVDDVSDYFYDDVLITYEVVNASDVHVVIRDLATGDVKYNFTSTNTSISDLYFDSGRYNITLSVEESDSTSYSSDSKVFNVLKVGSSIVVEGLDDYVYGDDVEVDVIVDNRTTVVVEIRDKTGKIVFNESIEEDYLPMPDLSAGEYVLFASNLKTDNVAGSNYTKAFTISKANSTIDIIYFNDTVPWGYYFDVEFDGDNLTDVYVIVRDSNGNEISGGNLTNDYGYFLYRLGNLTLGSYSIEIINPGDENITGCSVSMNFTIFKGNSTVYIENITSVYVGDDVFIEYYVYVPGIIDIVIMDALGNIVYHEENANIFNVTVSGLPAGYYTVNVTNLETENVFGNYSVSNFTVFKYDSNITLNDVKDVVYGENVLIGFEVENPTVVNVKITDANGNIVYDENETDYSVLITDLDAGDYTVNVTNIETFNVTASSDSKSFRVLKASIVLTVSVDDSVYGELSIVNVGSDVDGNYTVNIGDKELVVNVVNGQGVGTITLDAGDYTAKINFTDDNYDIYTIDDSFTVFKANVAVSVEVLDKVYTANVSGNVFASVDGEYKVVIGNFEAPVTVKDGVGSFDVGILNVGNYTASVSFNGTDNYNSADNETAFEVTQTGTNVNIIVNASEIVYGGVISITQGLPGDATGTVTYSFANGTVIKVLIVNESFVLSGLNAGSYVIYANYSGDANYAPASDSITIIVDKAVNDVLVYSSDVVYGEKSNVVVFADVDGEYAVVIGDDRFIVDVVDGRGNVEIALDAGSYDIIVEYVNDNYVNNVTSVPFTVSKANVTLTVEIFDKVYTADVSGNVFASVDGEYNIVIGNYGTSVTVKNGIGSFDVGILNVGNYTASVSFKGSDNYNPADNETAFEVTQTGTNFNIIANVTEIVYGGVISITQGLPGDATGTVTYSFANGTVIKVLIVNESFVLSGLNAGSYVIYANYSGDANYAPASDSITIIVDKAVNDVLVYSSDVVYGEKSNVVVFADVDGEYAVVIGDDRFIVDVVDGRGNVEIALDAGSYDIIVEYVNENYENNITASPFTVSKADITLSVEIFDKVYTADVSGNVFASVDGVYKVVIGNFEAPVTVKGGVGSFDVGILNVGNYTAFVSFNGSDNYNFADNETAFEVTQTGTNFNIIANVTEIVYGGVISITQGLPGDATGTVTYSFANGTVIKVLIVNESFVLSGLNAGSYVIYANYSGDANYAPASDSITIIVDKAVNDVLVYSSDVVYGEKSNVVVFADVDGEYAVVIGDDRFIVDVVSGVGNVEIALDAGSYDIIVEYVDDNYVNNVTSVPFTVSKADVTLSVEIFDKVYGANVTGNVFASVDGEFSVVIGNYEVPVLVKDGIGSFDVGFLNVGNYTAFVRFEGDDNYNPTDNETAFEVTQTGTYFNIIANATVITYGDMISITQGLPGDATDTVTYKFANGSIIKVLNVKDSFVLSGLNVGSYVINANYSGDDNYAPAQDSITITVGKAVNDVLVYSSDVVYGEKSDVAIFADADGEYTVVVGGKKFIVNVVDGRGNVEIALDAGSYDIIVEYVNDNYVNNITSTPFTVYKAYVSVSIEVLDKVYGDNIAGNVFASINGEYNVRIGKFVTSVIVKNGIGEFDAGIMGVGIYEASVSFEGNDNYNSAVNKTSFEVVQTRTNFNIIANATEIVYGGVISITQGLPGDATGTVTYSFANGTVIKVLIVNESFVLSGLNAGSYVIYANYSGDANYAPASDSITIIVDKAVNDVLVYSSDVVYGEISNVVVFADVDGEYAVVVGGKKFIVDVVDGRGNVELALDAGSYDIVVEYVDDNYENNVTAVPFTVSKADITLSVEVLDKVYTADVTGNVFASLDGNYTVIVGDNVVKVAVKNGIGSFDLGILSVGNYSVQVIFEGNENYNANSNTTSFEVTQTGTNFNIIANATEITYGDLINITQSLPADATGNVTYTFANGTLIKVVGNNESFILSDLNAGIYVIYANYSGDRSYASARDSVTITVNKAVNNVVVSVDNVTYADNVTINVRADVDGTYLITVAGTALEV
ncbi:right-handed parallel beta-helix repeat-containing protein, partial [uncultured Methanobrevibacter sp.]|uniref:right-handed parallel beta-helix repeat-containing protein n=1 Tax=uncultured Methanobrevibacter sp. TaxID=253161 RepID=UPI0025FFACFB